MAEAIQRGKIKKAPAKEVVEYLIRPGIQSDLSRSYQTILDVNKAHVLMLAKQGIISHEVAAQILRVTHSKSLPTWKIFTLILSAISFKRLRLR